MSSLPPSTSCSMARVQRQCWTLSGQRLRVTRQPSLLDEPPCRLRRANALQMEWVEALVARVADPPHSDPTAEDRFKEKLGILQRRAQNIGSTAKAAFIRPHCKEIEEHENMPTELSAASARANSSVIAFIPYLHFEDIDRHRHIHGLMSAPIRQPLPPGRTAAVRVHPHAHLIGGYSREDKPGDIPRWQPRRTLDGYFYTHLEDTQMRDADQVILRYAIANGLSPRILMVDQLWVWILGNETIITCSSLNWNSWVAGEHRNLKNGNLYALAPEDQWNVHQRIIKHLKRADRQPITSVHDLACLIADTCTELFDQEEAPDDFRFFDFFERDIARLSDTTMRRLEHFRSSLEQPWTPSNSETMPIKTELSLLVEIQDICDELEILGKVANDQDDVMKDMRNILASKGRTKWSGSRATELHTQWVCRMQKMATKTKESLYQLLNLKLKQASFTEATDTRKQAEDTALQTKLAGEHSGVIADQLKTMKEQALETGRQGKALMVFTVVTVIFLPSSFMAAVFSIDLDTFPADSNGRMPLDYFIKYLCRRNPNSHQGKRTDTSPQPPPVGIGCAITIPLLFVAFNLPRLGNLWDRTKQRLGHLWREDSKIMWTGAIGPAIALVVEGAVVGAIWAAPLAVAIKTAVTVCISLMVAVAVGLLVWNAVTLVGERQERLFRATAVRML
ncbi:hypothetical protein N658DRAFT_267125 [Parathielavia hyrcaniae]|uniref:Ankyrin repeat protein n=1 Tax=Parathielavia hyrcaniae TaxID=113614 RepID=A0AAN6PX31_9PEZI|nr:hypothetical protein N658DRAFT_267125 [Parathielavia hyrcaniae]